MAISDKTRKALWSRSGNRCAICRLELVQKIKDRSENLILGEECHIVSAKKNGPRGEFPPEGAFDDYNNLILLCANDHKRVDELVDVYPVDILKIFKEMHEQWVKTTLEADVLAFANNKNNIKSLPIITKGKQLVDTVKGAHLFEFDHSELVSEYEAETVGTLFDELKDYGDIFPEIPYSEIAKVGIRFNDTIEELMTVNILLFGNQRSVRLHNEDKVDMGVFDIATLIAVKNDNPAIVGDFLIVQIPTKFSFI